MTELPAPYDLVALADRHRGGWARVTTRQGQTYTGVVEEVSAYRVALSLEGGGRVRLDLVDVATITAA